jgi:hypothetical protein
MLQEKSRSCLDGYSSTAYDAKANTAHYVFNIIGLQRYGGEENCFKCWVGISVKHSALITKFVYPMLEVPVFDGEKNML